MAKGTDSDVNDDDDDVPRFLLVVAAVALGRSFSSAMVLVIQLLVWLLKL